jgi:hypothetical protein
MDCGEPMKGRADKRFCSDHCRNTYNNRLNGVSNNIIRNINHILRKNRNILEECISEGKRKIHKQYLELKGFNYRYSTHQIAEKNGKYSVFCYDYGYIETNDDSITIVKK